MVGGMWRGASSAQGTERSASRENRRSPDARRTKACLRGDTAQEHVSSGGGILTAMRMHVIARVALVAVGNVPQ